MNILLIEDNIGDVIMIQQALEESEFLFNLNTVHNGEIALAYLKQYEEIPVPDLILLDINLPRKDGFQVLEEIKRIDSLKEVPVIIVTSSSDNEDKLTAESLGARGFLTKPINYQEYMAQLREIMNRVLNVEK